MPHKSGISQPAKSSRAPLIVVVFGLFSDALLYNFVMPLLQHSPADVNSEMELGILYGSYALGVLLLTPLCGVLADRWGRRPSMIAGAILQAIATSLFAVAPNFWLLVLARIVQGGAAAAVWTVGLAIVAESYPDQRVGKMGLAMVGSVIGSLAGPLAGGLFYDRFGYLAPFEVAGAVVLVDLVLRVLLLPADRRLVAAGNALFVLIRNKEVLVLSAVVALIGGAWGAIEPHLPTHLAHVAGESSATMGVLFTISGLAYGLATTPVERLVQFQGLRGTISAGVICMAIGLPLLALSSGMISAALVLCFVSVGYACALNPTLTELAETVDRCAPGAYASVYAVSNIAYSMGSLSADVITDPLICKFSLLTGFFAFGLVMIACVPLLWRWAAP